MTKEDINSKIFEVVGPGAPPKKKIKTSPPRKPPVPAHHPPTPAVQPIDVAGVTVKAIKDNAKQLGLTWTLRPGTVTFVPAGASGNNVQFIYDGDSVPLTVQSLIGVPSNGSRAMGLQIPPSGNFLIGTLNGSVPSVLVNYVRQDATGLPIALTTVSQNVLSFTISQTGQWMWEAIVIANLNGTTTSVNTALVEATTPNGAEANAVSAAIDTGNNGGTFAQIYNGSTTSAQGSFTFSTRKTAAAGTINLGQLSVTVKVWQ